MKILGILPISIGGRLTTSSILDGFRQLGHTVVVYDELKDNYSLENNYDLIVGYDFSPVKLKRDNNLSMKCVAYFSDEIRNRTSGPHWKELLEDLERDDVYTFYWDRELVKQENFKNLFYLPHFVNTEIYKNKDIPIESDVMFAGRLDTDYRLNMIVDLVENLGVSFKWYAIERHYQNALKRVKNKQTIEKIYSGFIDNEQDMADAINKTKIVINMNSQGVSSLNYRTMQTLACKRLLISDERKELDLFDNKIPIYKNSEDLKEKILFYLHNEQEYSRVTEYCEKICREKYSSRQGVKYILDKIKA
mgnify:CR=1 FL=1